jgi:hypothetical protein
MTRAELARLGGLGKAAKQATEQRVLLEAVLPDDLALKSEADAQRLLELATELCLRGYLTAGQTGAVAKTVSEWLRAESQKLDRQRMVALEAQVAALRNELRAARKRALPEPDLTA